MEYYTALGINTNCKITNYYLLLRIFTWLQSGPKVVFPNDIPCSIFFNIYFDFPCFTLYFGSVDLNLRAANFVPDSSRHGMVD